MIRIPEGSAPNFKNKSWAIGAEITIPEKAASGVLATIGGRFGGWVLLMQDGKPEFAYALSNQPEHKFRIASTEPVSPGDHVVRFRFAYDGGGIGKGATGTLFVDGKQVAAGSHPSDDTRTVSPSMKPSMSATDTGIAGHQKTTPTKCRLPSPARSSGFSSSWSRTS